MVYFWSGLGGVLHAIGGVPLQAACNKDSFKFKKTCGIVLPIVIGLVNLGLSLFLIDAIISCMNLIIFIGATIYYFSMPKEIREHFNGSADGIIDIIMIVLSCAAMGFLIFKNKGLLAHK